MIKIKSLLSFLVYLMVIQNSLADNTTKELLKLPSLIRLSDFENGIFAELTNDGYLIFHEIKNEEDRKTSVSKSFNKNKKLFSQFFEGQFPDKKVDSKKRIFHLNWYSSQSRDYQRLDFRTMQRWINIFNSILSRPNENDNVKELTIRLKTILNEAYK